jgi:hypothetical protein
LVFQVEFGEQRPRGGARDRDGEVKGLLVPMEQSRDQHDRGAGAEQRKPVCDREFQVEVELVDQFAVGQLAAALHVKDWPQLGPVGW